MNRMQTLAVSLGAVALVLIGLGCGDSKTQSNPTFDELFASPDQFNGKDIALVGFFFQGWESIVLSQRMEPSGFAEGHLWPQGHTIWVEGSIPEGVYDLLHEQRQMKGPLERYGKVRIEGIFEYGGGYGNLGGFSAQIVPSEVELLRWSPPPTPEIPDWLTRLIQRLENEPVANPPASIAQYVYTGHTVYFLPPRCCDIFSDLYDADGNIIGHPDGGITGQGDGRVPDFLAAQSIELYPAVLASFLPVSHAPPLATRTLPGHVSCREV